MIDEFNIKEDWITLANKKSEEMGILNNSISKGTGNVIGFLGEIGVNDMLKDSEISNTYDYDIKTPKFTIDVKTKRCGVKPLDYYMCSVSAYNTKQTCDVYVFVRMLHDLSKGWVLGWIEKEKYFDEATFYKKGEKEGDNGFIIKADCYNLPIKKLHDIKFFS
jgi:hypothetical protein